MEGFSCKETKTLVNCKVNTGGASVGGGLATVRISLGSGSWFKGKPECEVPSPGNFVNQKARTEDRK